jgi:hypothetical protein
MSEEPNFRSALEQAWRWAVDEVDAARTEYPDADVITIARIDYGGVNVGFADRETVARMLDERDWSDQATKLRNPPAGIAMTTVLCDGIGEELHVFHDPPDYVQQYTSPN